MSADDLLCLSPLDGRYQRRTAPLRTFCSESAFIRYRISIEVAYLLALSKAKVIRAFTPAEKKRLALLAQPTPAHIARVKEIERTTHHDVKAIEYFIREQLTGSLANCVSFVHFGVTSEDVNNLAHRLMIRDALTEVVRPSLDTILEHLGNLVKTYHRTPMLARTHGQAAIPTTVGKELAVTAARLLHQFHRLDQQTLTGKWNGAVGGYHALVFAKPKVDWLTFSQKFVESFNLTWQPLTTQINPADDIVELFAILHHINSILVDLCQDMWRYISDDWFVQKGKLEHVGSSTMPHKINPIEFENAEGNLGLANALFEFFNRKLPISRLQRDLSDSTVLRNIGSAFGYSLVAYTSLAAALPKIEVNERVLEKTLTANYNILTEAWQTLARSNGDATAYETAAQAGKGKVLTSQGWQELTATNDHRLSQLTPTTYLGLSSSLALQQHKQITTYLRQSHQRGLHSRRDQILTTRQRKS